MLRRALECEKWLTWCKISARKDLYPNYRDRAAEMDRRWGLRLRELLRLYSQTWV